MITDFARWVQHILQTIGTGIAVRFREEPVLVNAFLRAIVVLGTAFFLDWDKEQIAAVYVVIESLTALISRQAVTPNVRVPE